MESIKPKVSANRFRLRPTETSIAFDAPRLYMSLRSSWPKKVIVYGPFIVIKVTLTSKIISVPLYLLSKSACKYLTLSVSE